MNTVAVIVNTLPNRQLSNDECYINALDFIDEIKACEKKKGGSHILGTNYLRSIAEEVGRRYDKAFNAYRHVVPSDYNGIEAHTLEETASVVRAMFLSRYPQIFNKYLETKFKSRPYGAKVVHFVGPHEEATAFASIGVEIIPTESVKDYLMGKTINNNESFFIEKVSETAMAEYLQLTQDKPTEDPAQDKNLTTLSDLVSQVEPSSNFVAAVIPEQTVEHNKNSSNKKANKTSKASNLSNPTIKV